MSRVQSIPVILNGVRYDARVFYNANDALGLKTVPFSVLAPGTTAGDVLTWDGTTWSSEAPAGGSVTLRGGDASTTTWASTMSGGSATAEYAPYQILRGGDANGA